MRFSHSQESLTTKRTVHRNGIIVKLENVNGKQVPAVTSQQLAEVFGKEHYNVLRDIRETVAKCSKSFCALNFEGAEYLDEQGKSRPMYLMAKDGFTMVAMAYTTPEAMRLLPLRAVRQCTKDTSSSPVTSRPLNL